MPRLIIKGCGADKLTHPSRAIDLYTGTPMRVVRNNRRIDDVVMILSAEHGLVSEDTIIAPYDTRISPQRIRELKNKVCSDYAKVVTEGSYDSIFWWFSKDYYPLLSEIRYQLQPYPIVMADYGISIARQQGVAKTYLLTDKVVIPQTD